MLIIVSDRNRLSKCDAQRMNALVADATRKEVCHVTVDDYGDAVRVFSLDTVKTISISELRKLLNIKPWTQRVYEWWQARKAVNI
jgi:hypothetical protein